MSYMDRIRNSLISICYLPVLLQFTSRYGLAPLRVPTQLTLTERLALYSFSGKVKKGSVFVEVGSYVGGSSQFLGYVAKENKSHLYCIDTWKNDAMSEGNRDTHNEFLKATKDFGATIIPLRGKSVQIAKNFKEKIDLLFIDGDHSYEGCRSDIKAWLPKMNYGSLLMFHDYSWAMGVQQAINEFFPLKKFPKRKIVHSLFCLYLDS